MHHKLFEFPDLSRSLLAYVFIMVLYVLTCSIYTLVDVFQQQQRGLTFRVSCKFFFLKDFVRYFVVSEKTSAANHVYNVTINIGKFPSNQPDTELSIYRDIRQNTSVRQKNVWVRMLCRVPGVSEKQATAICRTYPNILQLSNAFKLSGPSCIADLLVEGGRRVGPACASKLYCLLMSDDPDKLLP